MGKQNIEYTYSRILFNHKKKLNFIHATTCMYLENIILSVIHKAQKDQYCSDSSSEVSRVNNSQRQKIGYQGLRGREKGGVSFNGYKGFVEDDDKVLNINSGDSYTTL